MGSGGCQWLGLLESASRGDRIKSYRILTLVIAGGVALDPQATPARLVHTTLPSDGLADLPGHEGAVQMRA